MTQLNLLQHEVRKQADKDKAHILARFFKTGKGEYAEGDLFLGLTVPQSRRLAVKYRGLDATSLKKLLKSSYHEERLIALLILVNQFQNGNLINQEKIFRLYLASTKFINNWDLVDLTADKIVGEYLLDKPRGVLFSLARSSSPWERRIAVMATFQFIKKRLEYEDTFALAYELLHDKHDLVHKAVGWMLREVGKRVSEAELINFLNQHAKQMPRTMLRYAIERLPETKRRLYLRQGQ